MVKSCGGGMCRCIHGRVVFCHSGSKSDGDMLGELVLSCQMSEHRVLDHRTARNDFLTASELNER